LTARAARATTRRVGLRRTAVIRRIHDPEQIRPQLEAEQAYAAYAIAHLDPAMFHLAEFYEAVSGERRAIVMHARGGLGPSGVTLGDPGLVSALLRLHPGQRQSYLTCEPAQVDAILIDYDLWRPQTMLRQQLMREDFSPPPGALPVRRLIDADAHELNALYAIEEEGLRYSGRQVSEGIYFGAHHRGRLVDQPGTHVISPVARLGVVGNVFTNAEFRGRGYATAVTGAVTAELLRTCDQVVLNVRSDNPPALQAYRRLGYAEHLRFEERLVHRIGSPWTGLAGPFRRLLGGRKEFPPA